MKFLSNILIKAGLVVEGSAQFNSLAGAGTRMVVTDASGVVSTQAISTNIITSVFGRTGAVVAQAGDYTTAQVTESGNLYYTDARARAAISVTGSGSYNPSTGVITINGGVTSVNGLTGAVTLTTSNIAEGTNLYYTDARARAAISLTTTGTGGAATYVGGVLNIPQYQAVLTNPVTGTAAAGQVAYFTGASAVSGSNNLFWDAANSALGIGTNTPVVSLEVRNSGELAYYRNAASNAGLIIGNSNNIGYVTSVSSLSALGFGINGRTTDIRIFTNSNVAINSTVDNGARFQVYGISTFSDSVGIGTTTLTGINLRVSKNIGSATTAYGILQDGQVQVGVTAVAYGILNTLNTANTFTTIDYPHYTAQQGTIGTSTAITNQYGFLAQSNLTIATNNYGFYGNIASSTGRWNLYMAGTANNYLNGTTYIGTAVDDASGAKLQVSGSISITANSVINGVAVGRGAGNVATNTALGASALITNSTGAQNTSVGNEALRNNTTGLQNSAFGYRAARANTTGNTNSAFGIDALRVNTIGANNAAFGAQALDNNTAGNNTAIGTGALLDNTSGASNTALGYRAGYAGGAIANTTGSNNIFIGSDSIGESASDSNRTFIGNTSTTATWLGGNLLLGSRTNATARLQVTGVSALNGKTYVNTNADIATYGHSLQVLANASGGMIVSTTNTASGIGIVNSSSSNKTWDISPFNNDLAINESEVGSRMYFAAGGNVLIGGIVDNAVNKLQVTGSVSATLDSVINGVTIGKGAGSVSLNTAVGNLALSSNTTGNSNAAFGLGALGTITTGSDNVGIGLNAGRYRNGTTANTDSSGGVYVGKESRASASGVTNEIVIGSGAQGNGDNTVTIGNTGIVSTILRGNVSTNGGVAATGIIRSDAARTAAVNDVSIALLGSNITTYPAGFSMAGAGYGLNAIYAQHEQRFGGNATFDIANLVGGGLVLNKLAPTAAGTVTMSQATGLIRTMSNLHLMTQFSGNNNLTVTHMSGLHIYGHYRTSGTGTLTVSGAYYGIFLADPNEFSTGATITGSNWGFYQQGAAPTNAFEGSMLVGTTTTDANNRLVVSGNTRTTGNMTSAQYRLSALNTAPATSTSAGVLGEIRIDADHIYVCTATNTWKRSPISTF